MESKTDFSRLWNRRTTAILGISMAVTAVIVFAFLTWRELQLWRGKVREETHILALAQRSNFAVSLDYYNQGNALLNRREMEEATAYYREAFRISPDFAEAHNNLGIALAALGRSDEAMEEYREALRIRPDNSEAHYNLGVKLAEGGELKEAIEHLRRALDLRPEFPEARTALGLALGEQGRQ